MNRPKAFQTVTRKARKEHFCCECRNTIKKGETYQYSSGVWDYPASYKQCMKCFRLVSIVVNSMAVNSGGGEDYSFGDLREYFISSTSIDYPIEEVICDFCELWQIIPNDFSHLFKQGGEW